MLVPEKDRLAIYRYLFKEGVICTKDNLTSSKVLGKDAQNQKIVAKNLYVIKLLNGLLSKGCVKKVYSWKWFYYTLTEEGVNFLREYLHIPVDVIPTTWKKDANATESHMIGVEKMGGRAPEYRKRVDEAAPAAPVTTAN